MSNKGNNFLTLGTAVFEQLFKENYSFYKGKYLHLEIQDFVFPSNLDYGAGDIINAYQKLLIDFDGTLSLHAPFKEINPSSMDPLVRSLAEKRLAQALEYGGELGCQFMVVHSCYNPLMNYKGYTENWLENSFPFWDSFLCRCEEKGITVVVENVWDARPDHIISLLEHYESPYLQACLDTGHAHIFSAIPPGEWVQLYGQHLAYLHLHDNHGVEDEHLPPGVGEIDFNCLLEQLPDGVPLINEAFGGEAEELSFLRYLKNYEA